MAGTTGLEPATSAVTGQRSNQLSYVPQLHGLQLGPTSHRMSGFDFNSLHALSSIIAPAKPDSEKLCALRNQTKEPRNQLTGDEIQFSR